jgi:hypothetical protein
MKTQEKATRRVPVPLGSAARNSRRRARAGYTLLEVALASGLLIVLVGGSYTAVNQAEQTWGSVVQRTYIQGKTRDALRQVADEMKQGGDITIDTTGVNADSVRFRIPLSVQNGEVTWGVRKVTFEGGRPVSTPLENGWVEYRVITRPVGDGWVRRLVRRTLDPDLTPVGSAPVVAEPVDVLRNEAKGFHVERTNNLYTIHVRMLKFRGGSIPDNLDFVMMRDAHKVQFKTTVLTRNWTTASP